MYNFFLLNNYFFVQMFRIASADQDNRVGLSLNDFGKAYERKVIPKQFNLSVGGYFLFLFCNVYCQGATTEHQKADQLQKQEFLNISWLNAVNNSSFHVSTPQLSLERWKKKKVLQSEKKKDADTVQQAHAKRAGVNGVKVEIQVLGKRPNQEHVLHQTPAKRSILSSRVNVEKETVDGSSSNSVCNPKLRHRNSNIQSPQVTKKSSKSNFVVQLLNTQESFMCFFTC